MSRSSWAEVFASLPDSAFFEIVRHYLGPVRTPFHKPELMNRLKDFFERDEVRKRVIEYIEPADALVLTFVGYYSDPTEENLVRAIPGFEDTELRRKLLNLQERLLIGARDSRNGRIFGLTPLGEAVKEANLLGPGCILGGGTEAGSTGGPGWFDDNFLTAVLAFLTEKMPLFRREGGWRKKTLEILSRRFPGLFRDGRGEERLILTGRALIAAGMAVRRGDILVPVLETWRDLEERAADQRRLLLRARAAAGRSIPADDAVRAMMVVTDCLPSGRAYLPERLAELFVLAAGGSPPLSPRGARRIISHLELMGELTLQKDGRLSRSGPGVRQDDNGSLVRVSVTPAGDITLLPGTPLFCDLALAAEPVSVDVVTEFRLDKKRFLAGLDAGVRPEALFSRLERFSGRQVPPNLRTLAKEWETDYRTLSLKSGVVLRTEGYRRQIIEDTGVLNGFSHQVLGEGMWLLDPAEETLWREALAGIGIDRLPSIGTMTGGSQPPRSADTGHSIRFIPVLNHDYAEPSIAASSWDAPPLTEPDKVFALLTEAALSASLPPEEMEMFLERRDRRLILVPEQIRRGSWRYEVMTAKGLDYHGKLRLIEAALSGQGERLEITASLDEEVKTTLVSPVKLEKDGSEHVLAAVTLPEGKEIRIRVRKIGFLRRIRMSLF